MTLLSTHIKAARLWLGWDQKRLAKESGLSVPTVHRMESSEGQVRGNYENVQKVRETLEQAGAVFIEADADGGPGVRLRK